MATKLIDRRYFIGGSAAALAAGAAAGLATIENVSGQQRRGQAGQIDDDPLVAELMAQTREAARFIKEGKVEGARIAASTLRIWSTHMAASGLDAQIVAELRKQGRERISTTEPRHNEMLQTLNALGNDFVGLPLIHGTPARRRRAYDRVTAEGLARQMRKTADELDKLAEKWPSVGILTVQLQGNEPNCGVCSAAEDAWDFAELVCAAAGVIGAICPPCAVPALIACNGAIANYFLLAAACQLCALFGR